MFYKKQAAFTLLEMMVVVVIIGIIVSMIGPRIVGRMKKAKIQTTKATMARVKSALIEYSIDMGAFPSSREGLDVLIDRPNVKNARKWDGPYLEGQEEVPVDQWGNEFEYNCPPERFKKYRYFEIICDVESEDTVIDLGS